MRENEISCVFHYVPLHSAPAGVKFGRFDGKDEYTTSESDRLVRLPMYYNMAMEDMNKVIKMCLIHDLGECFTGDIPCFKKTEADEETEENLLYQWVATLPEPLNDKMRTLIRR